MDQTLLRQRASELEQLLGRYASTDEEAASLYSALKNPLADAQSGKLLSPLRWSQLPGTLYFDEGSLRKYRDLESAYSEFAIEATGGETPVLRELRRQMSSGT